MEKTGVPEGLVVKVVVVIDEAGELAVVVEAVDELASEKKMY